MMEKKQIVRIEAIEGEPIVKNTLTGKSFYTYTLYVFADGTTYRKRYSNKRKKDVAEYLTRLPQDRSKYNHTLEIREDGIVCESCNLFFSL